MPALVTLPRVTAFYWGYESMQGNPVRAALIGAGGQGRSHIDSLNPESIRLVAFSDIRPSQQKKARISLEGKYGTEAREIELIEDYHKLLDRDDIEMVIIALPLHLHAAAAIEAMEKGKHVLCEKLMAKTVADCKRMARTARKTGQLLSIGHQRHYSYLYANALEVASQKDILGDVRHIRAFWHRNQTEGGRARRGKGRVRHLVRQDAGGRPEGGFREVRVPEPRGTGAVAAAQPHRRRADGGTGQPPTGRLRHPAEGRAGRKERDAVHPKAVSGVGGELVLHGRARGGGPHVPDVRVSARHRGDLLEHHDQRGRRIWRAGDGDARNAGHPLGARRVPAEGEGAEGHADHVGRAAISEPSAVSTSTMQWTAGAGLQDTLTSRGYREEQEHLAWLIRESRQREAALRGRSRAGGRGGHAGLEHGGPAEAEDRVQAGLVRRDSNAVPEAV